MYVVLTVVLLTMFASAAARADTIYRCVGADGEAFFTDRACPGGALQTLDPADVLAMPALDAQDIARVQQLDKERAAHDRAAEKERLALQRVETRDAAARARSCAAAHEGLERVHEIKRRGYSVASAGDLQARERKYTLLAERNCG